MRYMLDTNMVSYIIKGHPLEIRNRLDSMPMDSITISAVTQGELLYGLARRGHPVNLAKVIREFLFRVESLPWNEQVANVYGDLRASCMSAGITLGALDMMIAAHAIAAKTILVTHDKAFSLVPNGVLTIEDWMNGV